MSTRHGFLSADFIDHLHSNVPEYAKLTRRQQWALADMLWCTSSKVRRHSILEDFQSFHYAELEKWFGREGFSRINERLQIFDVTPNWFYEEGATKGYKLLPKFQRILDSYFLDPGSSPSYLVTGNLRAIKKLRAAVASTDMRGSKATEWPCGSFLNCVPVRVDMLESLHASLSEKLRSSCDERSGKGSETIRRLLLSVACAIRLSTSLSARQGFMPHLYVEAESGRLYARGLSLQNAPNLVKRAALYGLWDYDFSNCHFTIFAQMSERNGYRTEAIQDYLSRKAEIRQSIAQQASISVEQAKQCLIAVMYGASTTLWYNNAIPREIGQDAAARLFAVPFFKDLVRDIDRGREVILNERPRTANWRLPNAMGKAIKFEKSKPMRAIAHLIQGVEALALKSTLELYKDEIVLLQHDGFAAHTRLDRLKIEQYVENRTGYRLTLDEKRIGFNPSELDVLGEGIHQNQKREACKT